MYPNPANDRLTITCGDGIEKATIYLYNNLGETIDYFNYSRDDANTVEIGDLASGIYFMPLTSSGYTERVKFIKN